MQIKLVNSQFHNLDVLKDIYSAGRLDEWLRKIIKGQADFRPLSLKVNVDGKALNLVESSIISNDIEFMLDKIKKAGEEKMILPNDFVDIFINFESKSLVVNFLD